MSKNLKFLIHHALCQQNPKNTRYPYPVVVSSPELLQKVASYDHVGALFGEGGYRSLQTFLKSDVSIMDCDNETSDDPKDWVRMEDLLYIFPDIAFAAVPSRNHGKQKGGKSPRPRFHLYFPHRDFESPEEETELKRRIYERYPFFDDHALDGARFIFGHNLSIKDILWHPGGMTMDEYLDSHPATIFEAAAKEEKKEPPLFLPAGQGEKVNRPAAPSVMHPPEPCGAKSIEPCHRNPISTEKSMAQGLDSPMGRPILEGNRNSELYHVATKLVKRFGVNQESYQRFMEQEKRCQPPLSPKEVASIWKSATKFGERLAKEPGYVSPEQYEKGLAGFPLMPGDFSDLGQAKVFYKEYKEELVYAEGTDFMRYNGVYWEESTQLAVGLCEDFMDRQLEETTLSIQVLKKSLIAKGIKASVVQQGGKDLDKACKTYHQEIYQTLKVAESYDLFVKKRRDMKYMEATLKAAKPMFRRDISTFDKNPFLLNTPKGTYDLTKGMAGLASHKAMDYITKVTSVSPDDQQGDLWQACLETIFQGDQSLIYYVQQMVGLAAIGKVYQEALIISYGEGSNGKSTFWNAISRVLGTYSGSLSADVLTVGCRRNVKPEMAELRGKRLVIASELEEGMRLNTSLMKQLCSTDEVAAEKKYKDPFRFTPTHTLVLCTNHLPKVGSSDKGTWRRLILIPFMAKLPDQGHVKNYADYLVQQAGGAILKWIIEGAEIVIHNQFAIQEPAVVLEAKGQYRAENDWLGIFLDDCCDLAPSYRQESGTLYLTYHDYCSRRGEYARSTTDFYTALSLAGYQKKRTSKGSFLMGLQLKGNVVKSGGAAAFGGIA